MKWHITWNNVFGAGRCSQRIKLIRESLFFVFSFLLDSNMLFPIKWTHSFFPQGVVFMAERRSCKTDWKGPLELSLKKYSVAEICSYLVHQLYREVVEQCTYSNGRGLDPWVPDEIYKQLVRYQMQPTSLFCIIISEASILPTLKSLKLAEFVFSLEEGKQ